MIGQAYRLTLFGPVAEIDEEHILFRPLDGAGEPVVVYRQDVEDLWNTLRLRGTVRETGAPQPIGENGASPWLFELLKQWALFLMSLLVSTEFGRYVVRHRRALCE